MKRYAVLAFLMFSSLALASDQQASCAIDEKSILSRSSSGVPQVSNLGNIEITCHAPGRPRPSDPKPGFGRFALRLKTVAYQISDTGTKSLVPSFSNVTGGSDCSPFSGECNEASLLWYLNIPIDPAEAISEFRAWVAKLDRARPPSPEDRQRVEENIRDLEAHPDELAEAVLQMRPGHFEVECRIMDGDQLWAVGSVELEILFKGRAFDAFFDTLMDEPQ